MSSKVVAIADAIVLALIDAPAGTFDVSILPERVFLPVYDLQEDKDLKISVVPKGRDMEANDRTSTVSDWQIDIGVQKKVGIEDPGKTGIDSEVPQLMELTEQIEDFLARKSMADGQWLRSAQEIIFSPGHLKEHRLFTGTLTLTYRTL